MSIITNTLYRLRLIPWIVIALSLFAAGIGYLVEPKPPIRVELVTITPQVASAGSIVMARYTNVRNRTCLALISMGWVGPLGDVVMRLPQLYGGLGRIGKHVVTVSIVAPYEAGEYCLRTVSSHDCTDGQFTVVSPEACIEVVP